MKLDKKLAVPLRIKIFVTPIYMLVFIAVDVMVLILRTIFSQ